MNVFKIIENFERTKLTKEPGIRLYLNKQNISLADYLFASCTKRVYYKCTCVRGFYKVYLNY